MVYKVAFLVGGQVQETLELDKDNEVEAIELAELLKQGVTINCQTSYGFEIVSE